MPTPFLELARRGQNSWRRYLLSAMVIIFCWFFLGSVPILALAALVAGDRNPSTYFDPATTRFVGIDPVWGYLALNLSFVALLVGLFIAVRLIHQRPLKSLVTPHAQINWRRIAQGFAAWWILALLLSLAEFLFRPAAFQFALDLARFAPFALLILIVTPLQTTAEELLFRGYLMQSVGLVTRRTIIVLGMPSALFLIGHLANPEVAADFWLLALYYFAFGAWLALITLKDNSLELALGVHAANNLFAALLFNYANSLLDTPAVFTVTSINPLFNLVSFLVAALVFYGWFFWRRAVG